jgi:RNA polymerase sigma factor (sigma-70 family)
MPKVKYYDGCKTHEFEVTDEQAKAWHETVKAEWRMEKAVRRELSTEALQDLGLEFESSESNPQEILEAEIDKAEQEKLLDVLRIALKHLTDDQQQIVKMKFYENKKDVDIARELDITKQAVSNRFKKILDKLKKYF